MVFDSMKSAQNILELVVKDGGKSVLVICKNMSDKAIGVLVANNERDMIRSAWPTSKPIGEVRRGTVENIAILTGGRPLFDKSGMSPEDVKIEDLGRADRVVVTKDYYLIIGGHGDKQKIKERTQQIRQRLRETRDQEERQQLRDLLVHFSAGVGELRIGGMTEQERKALTEVAEQAMKAVTVGYGERRACPAAAQRTWLASRRCKPSRWTTRISRSGSISWLESWRSRCGGSPPMREFILHWLIAEATRAGVGYGYDVREKKIVNMIDQGIADPTWWSSVPWNSLRAAR